MRCLRFAQRYRTFPGLPSQTNNIAVWCLSGVVAGLLLGGCRTAKEPQEQPIQVQPRTQSPVEPVATPQVQAAETPRAQEQPASQTGEPISLFDGQTLGQWKSTDFGGQGDVYVKDGAIYLEMGNYMTGITWSGPVIRMNYEITLEAMRVQGNDFFCALTFPVADKPCTLVLGGWGGSICGLSSIDYFDASENQTTRVIHFEKGKWYFVRLRVVPNRIQAWLDGEELVDFDTTDHKIGIRVEVDLSQPLGIATWMTAGAVRNIKLRELPEQAP